jgi:hypothetical protein
VLFQTQYALSVAYTGTAVLIEGDEMVRPTLPVAGRNIYVGVLGGPALDRVEPAAGAGTPVTTASTLLLHGRNLRGDVTRVRIGAHEAEPAEVTPTTVRIPLSAFAAGDLRAGVRSVSIVHRRLMGTPPVPHAGEESNALPLVIAPTVSSAAYDGAAKTVTVTLASTVGKEQRATLLLNRIGGDNAAFALNAAPRSSDGTSLVFTTPVLAAGSYLVRVRIDGAESPLERGGDGTFTGPTVVAP